MKIRRYVARDMRSALAQIKEELGPDAVIMSNKKIPEGVELMAAVDYNDAVPAAKLKVNQTSETDALAPNNEQQIAATQLSNDVVSLSATTSLAKHSPTNDDSNSLSALLSRKIQQGEQTGYQQTDHQQTGYQKTGYQKTMQGRIEPSMPASQAMDEASIKRQLKSFTERLQQSDGTLSEALHSPATMSVQDTEQSQASSLAHFNADQVVNKTSANANFVNQQEFDSIKNEMASIRQLLEHQVSGLMWQDLAQKDPTRAMLVERLSALGLTEQIADQIAGFVPKQADESQSWQAALNLLTQQINTTNNDIIHRGGVVALVGPTGVGKTTTIAKLAARFAQIHGVDNVALISTDTFRIAGFEQLQTYGRIIGCQVKLAKDTQTLDHLIQEFSKKKLVLIDTAGMGQRDLRLAQHLTTLMSNTRVRIRNYLVLAANTQQGVMQENVERFKKIPLVGCIYTKLDESLSMGEIITTAIQNGLPIGYLTDGQRVPEDIKVANAQKLVMLANRMISKTTPSHSSDWHPQANMSAAVSAARI